ncbi:type I restriction endonuclease subunit R [Fervidobacterium gondwanense]|uniref:type I restriction endonuclease subunit R n=1 Tax=Fervidobacterium gondwanense TaxID=44754 RepID=UPI003C70AAAC
MTQYNIVTSTDEFTVVCEYESNYGRAKSYQTEAELEEAFINQLISQGYDYLPIKNEKDLIQNLRRQLERINNYTFTDSEWERFFKECIANPNEGIVEKTRKIQQDYIQVLKRDDGTTKNIYLLHKDNIHDNYLQVINQYEETEGRRKTRYDVTILVNGLPLVHIELKRRGAAIREAFNQIRRYQRDSFWASSGLFEYVQIFVISNGTHTKYYSNTTRDTHIREMSGDQTTKKTSNSFEFTSYWADANNKIIPDLMDFTKTFFAKHTLLSILTKYCVFTTDELLLVMRPYQIAATERILQRILIAYNYKKYGTIEAGGYIWHTTGSGKTLTSFKTAQLATKFDFIDKVLFVVDRKDLDYQTMKEYDRFQKGAANGNTSTKILQQQLEDPDSRIIITTIQKLDKFIKNNRKHDVYNKHVVFIFDECHRSQFGEMHNRIIKMFKKYYIFGFTGTPIFAANAPSGGNPLLKTTEQAFGDRLHTYTIVDAINDGNVLPFRIDFVDTLKAKDSIEDKEVAGIDKEKALGAPGRIQGIVSYVLDHFDQKTKRSSYYLHKGRRVAGFNSIFAADSIPMAMKYYTEFKKQIKERGRDLNIAIIYSYNPNEEEPDVLEDESFDTDKLDKTSRDFLEDAIADYNKMFKANYNASSEFENYYKDISRRMKNREIDLLIVVNMFLTGFDATTLNTLWVDKNLRQHGLIQAFSRTNRILNSVKTYGNIVCFRDLKEEVDKAIALFGDKEARSIVLLKTYEEYYNGYEEKGKYHPGYKEMIEELTTNYPLGQPIIGEKAQKDFIKRFGAILKLRNILSSFDDFEGNEILSERDFQDYQSIYLDLYQDYRKHKNADKEDITDDIVFEIELVKQVEVNIDYILMMVDKYRESNLKNKSILVDINKAIGSSTKLRNKRELIEEFIKRVNVNTDVQEDWKTFVNTQKEAELDNIIKEEKLKPEETRTFINNAFRDGVLKTTGIDIDKILPPMSRFGNKRANKKRTVIEKLTAFFEKYFDLI